MEKGRTKETGRLLAKARPRLRPMKPRTNPQEEEEKKEMTSARHSVTKKDLQMKVEVQELPGVDDLLQKTAKPSRQALASSSTATKQEVDKTEDRTAMEKLREKYERFKEWNAEAQEKMVEQQNYIERQQRKLQRARKKREEAELQLEDLREWIAEWEAAKEKEEAGEEQPSEEGEEGDFGCWLRKPRVELVTANMRMLATVREGMVEYGVSTLQQMVPTVVRMEGEEERADGSVRYLPVLACRDCMRLSGELCRFPLPHLAIRHMQEEHGRGKITAQETREAAEAEWGSWVLGITKHLEVRVGDISPDVSDHSREELEEMARKTGKKILAQLELGGVARRFVLQMDEGVGLEWLFPFRIPKDMEVGDLEAVEEGAKWLSPLQQRVLINYVQQNEAIPDALEKALMKREHGVPIHVEKREERREEMRKAGGRRQQPRNPPDQRQTPQTTAAGQRQPHKARHKGK